MTTTELTERPSDRSTLTTPLRRTKLFAVPEMRWAAAATGLFLLGLAAQLTGAPTWLWASLYAGCYVSGGWDPALAGLRALGERRLDVDLLMIGAALGAAAIGQPMDGGLLIVIFATSGALEALATTRTEDSVRGLLDLAPETATRSNGSAEETVPAKDLRVGDVIVVRPGERIGADGRVLHGASDVDQASITGEPLPADKSVGDEVFAGTLNGTGGLRVRVERPAAESVVARIAALVEQASKTKARTQLFIEKVEQRYSVGVVVSTLLLFFVPLAFGADLTETLLRAMTFMIVASPCAVVLATMPPLLAAIANAGRHGVLVKSAVVMEQLGTTTRVAFDKTGTLTHGVPWVAEIRVLPGARQLGLGQNDLLGLAASVESMSEHPLAAAIVSEAKARGLSVARAEEFASTPGRGVRAEVDGRLVELASPAGLTAGTKLDAVTELESGGHTAVVVLLDGEPAGVLGIADRVRQEAASAVRALTGLTGSAPVLLTGDNQAAADRLAGQVGLHDVRAGLLPQDKVGAVQEWAANGERVTVVGDGVNDAPALAAAHAGIAMGGRGADLTLRSADAVVVRDDLSAVPAVIALSRRARKVVIANLAIAGTCIVILVAWDIFGHLPLPLGVAGHEGSTVIVGLNGLRMLRRSAWRKAQTVQ